MSFVELDSITSTSFTDETAVDGKQYEYRAVTRGPEGDSDPSNTVQVTVGAAPTQLGATFDADDLAVWRTRAANGPFRTRGDWADNSPNEWQTVLSRWAGNWNVNENWVGPFLGSYQPYDSANNNSERRKAIRTSGAAIRALVEDNANLAQQVGVQMRRIATQVNGADWRKLPNAGPEIDDGPVMMATHDMGNFAVAYDYVRSYLSDSVRADIERWLEGFGEYAVMRASRPNRFTDDPESNLPGTWTRRRCWDGGPFMAAPAYLNNRIMGTAESLAIAGGVTGRTDFIDYAKKLVRAHFMYSVGIWSDGGYFSGDMERAGDYDRGAPNYFNEGWTYEQQAIGACLVVAEVCRRRGDMSLYTFGTTDGYNWTTNGATPTTTSTPKTLLGFCQDFAGWSGGWQKREWNGRWINAGDYTRDATLAISNMYWKDSQIRSAYLRTAPTAQGWPSNLWSMEWRQPCGANSHMAPLFMWADRDGS